MNLSIRLKTIVDLINPCNIVADIGTDHGYIPIYLIENDRANLVIASDINKGPIETAKKNFKEYNVISRIETRLGAGLKTINNGEVDVVVIAGMGGNLIADIINDSLDIAKGLKYMILQPAQHQEVLREYLYKNGFKIIDENVVLDANKYYHTLKVKIGNDVAYEKDVYYYTGRAGLINPSNDFVGYINRKIEGIEKIIGYTAKGEDKTRYDYLVNLLKEFRQVKRDYDL
ncbi:MAG: class I SAM-dependent methyltransferase [Clostridium sp.]